MALNDHTVERNFGHCRILWDIKNFSMAICNPERLVVSKEFSITSTSVTRWKLGFSLENDCHKLKLFLQRLNDDYEDNVKVSWKVTILDSKNEGTFIAENQIVLSQNSYQYVDTFAPLNFMRVLNTDAPNKVSIMYEIIVLLNTPMEIATPRDKAITGVFKDLATIYDTGHHSNVAIKLNGTTLNLHKAILFPRSQKLADRVGNKSKKMQLHYTDVLAIKKLFAYLYTAELSFIFDSPTISMNEYIRDLDIKELRNSYPQEKISMETIAHSKLFEFHWIIPNVCNQQEMQESSVYTADEMRTAWQLRIYPEGLPEDAARRTKYVYIEALQINRISTQDVYVDFKAIKKDGRVVAAKRKHATVENGSTLGERFMRLGGYAMSEALIGNSLHVQFFVCEATGLTDTRITETQGPLPFNLTNYDTYKISADYLGLLQTTHAYSDIALKVENREFRCHKFILASRSSTFYSRLESIWEDNASLTINYANKHAFRVFLDFVYTGNITDVDIHIMIKVYDLASQFRVASLTKCCLVHIRRQMNTETIWSILSFAQDRCLTSLKTTALNFIFHARDDVLHTDGWRAMELQYPRLTSEILDFVKANMNRLPDALYDIIPEDPELEMEEDERPYPYDYNVEPQWPETSSSVGALRE